MEYPERLKDTMMKLAIYGYGNLGRGVECAAAAAPDAELIGVFTRRAPETVKVHSDVRRRKGKWQSILFFRFSQFFKRDL